MRIHKAQGIYKLTQHNTRREVKNAKKEKDDLKKVDK